MTGSLVGSLILAAGLVLVALALWNWRANGWEPTVWLLCFVAQLAIRIPQARRARKNTITAGRRNRPEQAVLLGTFAAMMFLPLLDLATPIFAFADYALPAWAGIVGAAVQAPFLWLFWRSHADLGRNWSPGLELHSEHRLVTEGVYARIRHPMYAALWLSALAQPLLVQNWIGGALAVPAMAAMWFVRVPIEEAMMRERFGAEYDSYCLRAGRLLPKAST